MSKAQHRCDAAQEADPVRGGCGAHGGHETAETRDVRRTREGCGLRGGQEKEWMGCLLDDLRVFSIDPDKWTITAQDEGEWHWKTKQGAELFMTKNRARAALRYAESCPNVTGRTQERVAQSKRARTGLLEAVG